MSSRLGIGTARLPGKGEALERLKEAMVRSLQKGTFRVVDTSSIFENGEETVADVLKEIGEEQRSQVMVVSKCGYSATAFGSTDEIEVEPGIWHSLSGAAVSSAINSSLERLDVPSIDCYMLQNPEHAFDKDLDANIIERLLPGMRELEKACHDKVISSYGVSSNALALPEEDQRCVRVDTLLGAATIAAHDVGNDSHSLRALQLPLNPLETAGLEAIRSASSKGLHVMTYRGLTAYDALGSWKLVAHDAAEHQDAESGPCMREMRRIRDETWDCFSPPPPLDASAPTEEELEIIEACAFLSTLVRDLDAEITNFTSLSHYEQNLMQNVIPTIDKKIEGMDETSADQLESFFKSYGSAVREVVQHRTRLHLSATIDPLSSGASSASIATRMTTHEIPKSQPLHEYALKWQMSERAIGTVLVGASAAEQIDEYSENF